MAAVPVPSALPVVPARPASVVTTPAGVAFRIKWLSVSATKKLPALSTATSEGLKNLAPVPVPSVLPLVPACPASVETISGVSTTSVAGDVVMLPLALVITHWNASPFIAAVTEFTVKVAVPVPL